MTDFEQSVLAALKAIEKSQAELTSAINYFGENIKALNRVIGAHHDEIERQGNRQFKEWNRLGERIKRIEDTLGIEYLENQLIG